MASTAEVKTRESLRQSLIGCVFGRLCVTQYVGVTPRGKHYWSAVCECGKTVLVAKNELSNGDTSSCGCLHKEKLIKRNKQSTNPWRQEHQREYNSYISARRRCLEPTDKDYHRYGAVGITFHAPWAESFRLFVEHIGPRPHDTTLDRIDTARGYEPGNVRWASPREQAKNRRSTVWVMLKGARVSMVEAARALGVTGEAVKAHLKKGGTLDGYDPRGKSKKTHSENARSV